MVFEATLAQASLWKHIVEAIRELVGEGNIECQTTGIQLQAMDNSHVSLVSFKLKNVAFDPYTCDRNISMGVSIKSLAKILKCAQNDDTVTMKCEDGADTVTFIFDSKDGEKVSEFQLKLMEIDAESLSVPDQEHTAEVRMPSAEFQRICRDLSALGDSVGISVTKEGVRFSGSGDIGSGTILVKAGRAADNNREDEIVLIDIKEPVSLNFALRHLTNFAKAASLSNNVILKMAKDTPLMVEFNMENKGFLKYFLAPKLEGEEDPEEAAEE